MTGFTYKILNNSIQALQAQQGVLANTSNNISNANTPGYANRTVRLEARVTSGRGELFNVGNGVKLQSIERAVDEFVDKQHRDAISEKYSSELENDFIGLAEGLFSLTGDNETIGSALTKFFNTLNDLSTDPSSLELRAVVLEAGEDLVRTISSTYNELANLQGELDRQLVSEIDVVNSLTAEIAGMNAKVVAREGLGDVVALDERDQRDALLQRLAEKIEFQVVEDTNGAVNVYLTGGTQLVTGSTSRDLVATDTPSFGAPTLPPALNNGLLHYVTVDYGDATTPAHVDLTSDLSLENGLIGGLLRVRGVPDGVNDTSAFDATGFLPTVATRVEAITRQLLTTFNTAYLGATDENTGTAGFFDPSSGDLDGNAPAIFGMFDISGGGIGDADTDGTPDASDLAAEITAGTDNFSSILTLVPTNGREIAAALDLDATNGTTSFAPGDSGNLDALIALRDSSMTFTVEGFSQTSTLEGLYNNTVTIVANEKARAQTSSSVAEDNLVVARTRREEVSGVSLDEEFANLVKFQKAFEASARMIRVADEMLEQITNLI